MPKGTCQAEVMSNSEKSSLYLAVIELCLSADTLSLASSTSRKFCSNHSEGFGLYSRTFGLDRHQKRIAMLVSGQ